MFGAHQRIRFSSSGAAIDSPTGIEGGQNMEKKQVVSPGCGWWNWVVLVGSFSYLALILFSIITVLYLSRESRMIQRLGGVALVTSPEARASESECRLVQRSGGVARVALVTSPEAGESESESRLVQRSGGVALVTSPEAGESRLVQISGGVALVTSPEARESESESRLVQRSGGVALVTSPEARESYGDGVAATCNMFSGNWVFDNKSYPLYRDWNCSFMIDDLACEKYHRKDLNYQHWRWQPNDCELPRFNAKALLEVLRNKRLVFVGDSLNRNQWVSFVCLIESSIPPHFKSRRNNGNLYSFSARGYNATVDFYWAPLLVESNSDNPYNHSLWERILRIESIEKHAKHWGDADILVFNSYAWWRHPPKVKLIRGSFGNAKVHRVVKSRKCYQMALNTWSKWVLSHLDLSKTRLFWMSMSPSHSRRKNWGMPPGKGKCMNETQLTRKEQLRGSETDPEIMRITQDSIQKLKARGVKIDLLDITQLSEYRKDAHPTIYRKLWRPLTKQQLANPLSYADCTHWCLPGVPDVWNEILYAYLIN